MFVIFVFVLGVQLPVFGDSYDKVNSMLKEAGLKVGYEKGKSRIVKIGSAERIIVDPKQEPLFYKIRNDLGKIAILNAKKEVMFNLSLQTKGEDVVAVEVAVDSEMNAYESMMMKSVMEAFSELKAAGCKVLCTAESWDPESHIYSVSAAVGWSVKACAMATKTLNINNIDNASVDKDNLEWKQWFASNDVSAMLGSRDFRSLNGARRFIGIGSADCEELTGIKLKNAMRVADMQAIGNLAFSIYSDTVAKDIAKRYAEEMRTSGGSTSRAWEEFCSEIIKRCSINSLPASHMYSKMAVNPITGKRCYLSVYGIALKPQVDEVKQERN